MNDLEKYFYNNKKRVIFKSPHSFPIYDRHFSKFRNTDVRIMEVGIEHGGCLQMWKDYFGSKAIIYGVDIVDCSRFEENQIKIFKGKQEDRNFWQELKTKIDRIDIIIDDCSHRSKDQIIMFEEMYPFISSEGIYACEDLHTSYWEQFGGGLRNPDSFIEYSKGLIDKLNWFYWKEKEAVGPEFYTFTYGIYYYSSSLIIEKGKNRGSSAIRTGEIL